MNTLLSYLLVTLYVLTIAGVILVILSENRNPLKSLSWVIVLVLAPVVGLVCYFFFGQNLSKRRTISRRLRKQLESFIRQSHRPDQQSISPQFRPLEQLVADVGNAPSLYDTEWRIFRAGEEKFTALLEDIAHAKHHIHLQYYIIDNDQTGQALLKALVEKARQGVEVRVLYDDVGSRLVRIKFFTPLLEAGGEASPFLHVQFPRFTSKVNYRNHRKLVIIDGRIGYFGGMNLADRYRFGSTIGPWRDTHLRITGGGVTGLQAAFLSDWYATTRQRLTDESRYYPTLSRSELADDSANAIQFLSSGPMGKWRTLPQMLCMAVGRATSRIWIQTPYYLPSEQLNSALQTAALAGIDVRLMLPHRSDSSTVDLAVHSYLDDMVRAGVKVSFYMAGFLHAKTMIIDDSLSILGSANMDFRSFEHNFELSGICYDRALNQALADHFLQDEEQCHPIIASEWFRRPRVRRLAESLMRLFSPLM